MSQFEETVVVTERGEAQTDEGWVCADGPMSKIPEKEEADYRACMLGLRDYVNKNGFKNVVLGLSGGIDSAICAALAVDALGEERVRAVMMPYRYTSKDSLKDAEDCARALGCRYDIVPIFEPVDGFSHALTQLFEGTKEGITEENLQSRARGTILMAISNKFGSMVVTTGNKSEMSVGYATLYGDMNGGFNPIKDLYKMQVYALSRWRNTTRAAGRARAVGRGDPEEHHRQGAVGGTARRTRPTRIRCRPIRCSTTSWNAWSRTRWASTTIVARGHDRDTVHRIEHLLYIAEYKRRQAAPGVKITKKNFGRDRRYPITNRFRDRG